MLVEIKFPTTTSLEEVAQALAEGEHELGEDYTHAGYALIMWPGNDCPWGRMVDIGAL